MERRSKSSAADRERWRTNKRNQRARKDDDVAVYTIRLKRTKVEQLLEWLKLLSPMRERDHAQVTAAIERMIETSFPIVTGDNQKTKNTPV